MKTGASPYFSPADSVPAAAEIFVRYAENEAEA
jgi:hypothetical protein